MPISGLSVTYTVVGGIILWSGIKGETLQQTFKGLASGQAPTANTQPIGAPELGISSGTAATNPTSGSGATGASAAAGNAPASDKTGTPTANKAVGQLMAAAYGWTGDNWDCLESGWEEESGWNQYAAYDPSDPYDYAYGIPQSNPGTKMASAGSDWKTNPITQIKWGLGYIKSTYGSPSQVPGWTPNGPGPGYVGY
jgi:hypothetical protein